MKLAQHFAADAASLYCLEIFVVDFFQRSGATGSAGVASASAHRFDPSLREAFGFGAAQSSSHSAGSGDGAGGD